MPQPLVIVSPGHGFKNKVLKSSKLSPLQSESGSRNPFIRLTIFTQRQIEEGGFSAMGEHNM